MTKTRNTTSISVFCLANCLGVFAQTGITVVGNGFPNPVPHVTAGTITTFFITGSKNLFPAGSTIQRATQTPLPTTLGGFSATMSGPPLNTPLPLPMFSVEQVNNCTDLSVPPLPECVITAIMVQIPFTLITLFTGNPFPMPTTVSISDGSGASKTFFVYLGYNFHIVNTCDSTLPNRFFDFCTGVVTHADGTMVDAQIKPARVGEELVLYAFGLGDTSPTVPAGQATQIPAPTLKASLAMSFGYGQSPVPLLQRRPWSQITRCSPDLHRVKSDCIR